VAPLMVPFLAVHFGWRSAFIFTGALGFIWVALWMLFFRDPETAQMAGPPKRTRVDPLGRRNRGSARCRTSNCWAVARPWAFMVGKFLTDPVWWFYSVLVHRAS